MVNQIILIFKRKYELYIEYGTIIRPSVLGMYPLFDDDILVEYYESRSLFALALKMEDSDDIQ
ncbi:hypothetical protein D1BOALGB6SA_7110 [Olavius sp. associated proteobacterium Delta 1]|nr:hypothetical protein D1BOALGB6SA_7110 [Olavius sp. associated proteobacterium Delta 1]